MPWASDRTGHGRLDVADFRPVSASGESSTDHRDRYGRGMDLRELQDVIDRTYGERDRDRGVAPTVAWLAEEFGELAQAVRKGTPAEIAHEFSDVLAWVATLANQVGVDLTEVVDRYRDGCPKCASTPCSC